MDCPQTSAPETWARIVGRDVVPYETEPNTLPRTLRELARQDFSVSRETRAAAVAKTFDEVPELPGVLVCDDGELLGLISRAQFQEQLSHPFGVELYLKTAHSGFAQAPGERDLGAAGGLRDIEGDRVRALATSACGLRTAGGR